PRPQKEAVLTALEGRFRCTIYYTPREFGFTRARGFDVTPETRPGLEGRKYPRDFLKTVEVEGFGRMKSPVHRMFYIRCLHGDWGFAARPVDQHDRRLVPKRTCAAAAGQQLL